MSFFTAAQRIAYPLRNEQQLYRTPDVREAYQNEICERMGDLLSTREGRNTLFNYDLNLNDKVDDFLARLLCGSHMSEVMAEMNHLHTAFVVAATKKAGSDLIKEINDEALNH